MEKAIIVVAVLVQCWLLYRSAKLLFLERSFEELSGRYSCSKHTISDLKEKLEKAEWREPLREKISKLEGDINSMESTISYLNGEISRLSKTNAQKEIAKKQHEIQISRAEYNQFRNAVELMLGGKNGTPDR